jgi:hypothetical protein
MAVTVWHRKVPNRTESGLSADFTHIFQFLQLGAAAKTQVGARLGRNAS